MRLKELGWNDFFAARFAAEQDAGYTPARVIEELKGHYRVAGDSEYLAQLSGAFRFDAESREELPAVGDWVCVEPHPEGRAVIHALLPRRSKLSRKAAGRAQSEQVLAANVDAVFIVSALNQELNLRRIERYVALVWDSGAMPVVLLNKADLCPEVERIAQEVSAGAPGVDVVALSCVSRNGFSELQSQLKAGRTYAFLGSSGVGKSTLVNALYGGERQVTGAVRESDSRGRHTTTSRQLFSLPEGSLAPGAIVIDTPGMRELQLWGDSGGLASAFDELAVVGQACRFRDCKHESEPGCAVRAAIAAGELDEARLANYQKLEAELDFARRKSDIHAAQSYKQRIKKLCRDQKRHYKRDD